MEFFVWCRDRPGTAALRRGLTETHWVYMDRFADTMIARGPALGADGAPIGSMHILDLPDPAAARAFAFEEPYAKSGVFAEVLVRRWANALGRTMWDWPADPGTDRRFLVIGTAHPGMTARRSELLGAHQAWLNDPARAGGIILRGPLLSDDGAEWLGSAMLLQQPDAAAARGLFEGEPYHEGGLYAGLEILPWRFGGRH